VPPLAACCRTWGSGPWRVVGWAADGAVGQRVLRHRAARPARLGVTRRCRTGRTDAGWQLKIDNGCSTSRSDRGGGFTSSSESSPYVPAPSWSQERSGARSVAVAGRGDERAGRRPGKGKRAALARGYERVPQDLLDREEDAAKATGGDWATRLATAHANVVRQAALVFFQLLNGDSRADPDHPGQNPVGSVSSSGSAGRSSWCSGRNAAVCSSQIRASYRPPILVST
jgi:hypothetical protein